MESMQTVLLATSSVLLSTYLFYGSYKKQSLDLSGLVAAIVVGGISFYCGIACTTVLLYFFLSSSKLTKYKADVKIQREYGYKTGGSRNWEQVVANGGFPSVLLFVYILLVPFKQQYFLLEAADPLKCFLLCTFVSVYCANCADTWSSEVGILSKSKPRYILNPFKVVPHGTNGGVTWLGYKAATYAGLTFGIVVLLAIAVEMIYQHVLGVKICSVEMLLSQWPILLITLFSGLFGTTLDSVLGALLEYSGFSKKHDQVVPESVDDAIWVSGINLMSGSQVNFLSGAITGLLSGALGLLILRKSQSL